MRVILEYKNEKRIFDDYEEAIDFIMDEIERDPEVSDQDFQVSYES